MEGGAGLGGGFSAVHLEGHRGEVIRRKSNSCPKTETEKLQSSRYVQSCQAYGMSCASATDLPIPMPPLSARLSCTLLALSSWGRPALQGSGIRRCSTMAMSRSGKEPALVGVCTCDA